MSNSFRGVKKSQEADILFCVSGVRAERRWQKKRYSLIVTQLPPECKWQDLKDSLRYDRKMRARPGWTDVMIQMSSGTAVRQGIFKIKSFEEANRVYCRFIRITRQSTDTMIDCLSQGLRDGTRLQVHQWDISKYPPSLLNCNCSTVFGTSGHSSQLSTMGSQIANQLSQQFVQIAPVQTATDQVIGGWDPQSTPTIVIAGAENGKVEDPASVHPAHSRYVQQDFRPIH